MITVATCNTIDEALLLRSVLEGSGIAATVPDELTSQTAPPYMFATPSRVRLQVAEADAPRAREVLAAAERRDLETP
ncbi:MAG TPA: DUF2007 domain-containing protein [Opitutus sp.]|nr:DUF2007 domain-containing protein [Opitutus sp.]